MRENIISSSEFLQKNNVSEPATVVEVIDRVSHFTVKYLAISQLFVENFSSFQVNLN